MQRVDLKSTGWYLLWVGGLGAAFILLPYYLGSLIAQNQWQLLSLLTFGSVLIALYFMEARYLILCTAVSLLFASSHFPSFMLLFGKLRWVFLTALALRAISDLILGRVMARVRPVDLWAFGFLALAFYSQTYSIFPELTFQRSVAATIFYLAVFWGVWGYARDEHKTTLVVQDFLKLAFFILLAGLLVNVSMKGRFVGFFASPNALGLFVAILMPLALWSFLCRRKQLTFYLLGLMLVSLFLSGSRAGILSTGIGAGYFLMLYFHRQRYLVVTGIIFLTLLMLLLIHLFGSSLVEQYLRWEFLATGSGRLEAWKEVIRLISLRPWMGYGFGTEDQLFFKFDIVFLEHAGASAHNSYIGLMSQLGLIGTLLLFVPLFYFLMRRIVQVDRAPSEDEFWLNTALNASILAGLTNAMFESWMYSAGSAFNFPFWVVVALAYRLDFIARYAQRTVPA